MSNNKITRRTLLQWGSGIAGLLLLQRSGYSFSRNTMEDKKETSNSLFDGHIIMRRIPSSGEQLPVIGMGTWLTFDVGNSANQRKNLKEVLRIFYERGGKLIDSSPMYGSSEAVVGDLSTELNPNNKFFLATKVWTSGEQNGIEQMKQSFAKMKTAKMDLMQIHNLLDADVHFKTLRKLKEEGKIRYVGITHYVVSAYPDLMRIIKKEKPDFVQFNYNMAVRDAEKQLLPFCIDNGIAVINNRPFNGGDLFNNIAGKALPAWAKDYDINNWAQFFLKYIVAHPAVTCAIPATSNPHHMQENIGAAYGKLPYEAGRKKMAAYFDNL